MKGMGMQSGRYEIRIQGTPSSEWMDWFDGMEVRPEAQGETLLVGVLPDQAALHGILARIRDLNLTLVSVNRVDSAQGAREAYGREEEGTK